MRNRLFLLILLLLTAFSCVWNTGKQPATEPEPALQQKDTVYPLGFCTDSFRVVAGLIAGGDNFVSWVTRLGLPSAEAHALVQACDTVFDVRKLRAGNTWKAYYQDSTLLRYIVYDNSRLRQTVFCCRDSLADRKSVV